VREGKR